MSRHFARLMLVVFAVAAPSVTSAQSGQSAIAGVARDSTGAVLPGVTVEASSPALIEKSRSAVTDEAGQYRVVDLRPGTYRVTFTLPGFTTVIRDGIVLESNFVAPVNVDMAVGGVEQAITVTGESPIVDVQSSQRRDVVNSEMLEALPTGRSFVTMAGTVPAVSTGQFDVGGSTSMWQGGSLTVHGSLNVDSRTLIDGMVADAMFAGGQCACVYDNEAQTQEIAVQVSAGSAENQLSGVLVNRIPRSGGNTLSAELLTNFSNNDLASQNLDDDLIARGLPTPAELYKQYDINYTVAGPVIKDRLWFFVSGRNWAYNNYVGGAFNADGTQARGRQQHQGVSGPSHRADHPEQQGDGALHLVGEAARSRQPVGNDRSRSELEAEPACSAHRAGEMDVDALESRVARCWLQPDVQQRQV